MGGGGKGWVKLQCEGKGTAFVQVTARFKEIKGLRINLEKNFLLVLMSVLHKENKSFLSAF